MSETSEYGGDVTDDEICDAIACVNTRLDTARGDSVTLPRCDVILVMRMFATMARKLYTPTADRPAGP